MCHSECEFHLHTSLATSFLHKEVFAAFDLIDRMGRGKTSFSMYLKMNIVILSGKPMNLPAGQERL